MHVILLVLSHFLACTQGLLLRSSHTFHFQALRSTILPSPKLQVQRQLFQVPHRYQCQRSSTQIKRSTLFESLSGEGIGTSRPSIRVGIVGAGSIAFGTASLLSSLGHDPMIWSPSGAGTKELVEGLEGNRIITSQIESTGAIPQLFNARIARSPAELVRSNDNILVLALPVNGHKSVMESLAPDIIDWIIQKRQKARDNEMEGAFSPMHIIISSHASLGAVYFMQLLRKELCARDPTFHLSDNEEDIGLKFTAWGTTAITARKTSGRSVNVLTTRKSVDFCTVPSDPKYDALQKSSESFDYNLQSLLSDGYQLCTTLFGERFQYREGGLLAISLSNLNPQNHLGIVLGNMSRMDPPPPPPPLDPSQPKLDTSIEPWYQGKNITPNVGRLMEALDRERIEIATALGIDVRNIYQHFSWSFHVPLETPVLDSNMSDENGVETKMRPSSVSEMNQQMHYFLKNDVLGPSVANSRYVLEDVPYGLVLTVILGQIVGRPAVLHEAGIRIVSAMYERDFMTENEILQGLGLIGEDSDEKLSSLDRWRQMAYSGYFRDE